MRELIATRQFLQEDQVHFARLSGDYNPMHMDAIAARRTQAGAPAVHGIHTLAWFLDAAARRAPNRSFSGSLKVRFDKFVVVGETVAAFLLQDTDVGLKGEICVESVVVARIVLRFGPASLEICKQWDAPPIITNQPFDLDLQDLDGRAGRLSPVVPLDELAAAFPSVALALGPNRFSALIGTTYLVGMVCPGLHSIFGGLTLAAYAHGEDDPSLTFKVNNVDPRFRVVNMSVQGGGWFGEVNSFSRHKPTEQPSVVMLREVVGPNEFLGRRALVVGGSRGLGELTAKIIAVGGGEPIITYTTGEADARRVAAEINDAGGTCSVLHYDVRNDAVPQLEFLSDMPTSLYYMATPMIFRRKKGLFDRAMFDEFTDFYVAGFLRICESIWARSGNLRAFYPSTIFVENHPTVMSEYAMTKMAGEILCSDMNKHFASMHVIYYRLPRLLTDQTASLQQIETGSAVETILEQVRLVEASV